MQHRSEGVAGLCSDCPHWDHLHEQAGICRRHAPQNIDWHPNNHDASDDAEETRLPNTQISGIRPGMFPNTKGNDWCGEHPLRIAFVKLTAEDMHHQMVKRRVEADREAKHQMRHADMSGRTFRR